MRIIRARIEWKLEDMWIGVFWRHGYGQFDAGPRLMWTEVWICVLPCLPLHLAILRNVTIPMADAEPQQ